MSALKRSKIKAFRANTTWTKNLPRHSEEKNVEFYFSFPVVYFTIESNENAPTVDGGPFKEPYEFSQLHFHWGDNDTYGSEGNLWEFFCCLLIV